MTQYQKEYEERMKTGILYDDFFWGKEKRRLNTLAFMVSSCWAEYGAYNSEARA
jgi:hypothetical protein